MDRFRVRLYSLTLCAGLLIVFSVAGRGQVPAAWSRVVLGQYAPPPIERGIIPIESRAPDSPETRQRLSIRPASGAIDRAGASGARYVPGQVIVKFRDGASTTSRVSALSVASGSASISRRPSYADFDLVQIDANEDAEAVALVFSQQADVEYAQAAYRIHPFFKPNDQYYNLQWNLPLIEMESAWDIQPAAGSTITVAVIDTGIAYANTTVRYHASAFQLDSDGFPVLPPRGNVGVYPALGDLTLSFVAATQLASPGRFVSPHDFIWDDDLAIDLDGHGTHVSGTIGQLTNDTTGTAGVAFNVKLMPVKVLDGVWDDVFGAPHVATDDVVARGIRYAADNGAKVLNMSLGRNGPTSPVIEAAIRYAVGKGAFVAIAGGNDFEAGNGLQVPADTAPRVAGAVAVAAIDRSKARAFYSSTGPWIELAAPGGSFRGFGAAGGVLQQTLDLDLVETFSDVPSKFTAPRFDSLAYFYFSGTSMSTPHVAGVAAMLMQQGITDPAAVEAALEKFATDLGDSGRDQVFGFGLVHARNTLRGLGIVK